MGVGGGVSREVGKRKGRERLSAAGGSHNKGCSSTILAAYYNLYRRYAVQQDSGELQCTVCSAVLQAAPLAVAGYYSWTKCKVVRNDWTLANQITKG